MERPSHEITQLLRDWSRGDRQALQKLTPLVYEELHRIAHQYMTRERPDNTLQTTALINEAYVRLLDLSAVSWQDRAHFFAVCAQVMRRILTDFARARQRQKRGAGARHVFLEETLVVSGDPQADLVALDEALNDLSALDPRKGQVVELRFFGGLKVEEVAEVLKVSSHTVMRDWDVAKAWLARQLSGGQGVEG